MKSLAVENMATKQCLKEKLVVEGCGRWVVKPVPDEGTSLERSRNSNHINLNRVTIAELS